MHPLEHLTLQRTRVLVDAAGCAESLGGEPFAERVFSTSCLDSVYMPGCATRECRQRQGFARRVGYDAIAGAEHAMAS